MADTRIAEALDIREVALAVLRHIGRHQTTNGKTPVRITMAETDGLLIVHNTPFTPRPTPSDEARRALDQAGRQPLPHALDIWDGKAKKFSLAWGRGGLRLNMYRRGPWIDRLRAALDQG